MTNNKYSKRKEIKRLSKLPPLEGVTWCSCVALVSPWGKREPACMVAPLIDS